MLIMSFMSTQTMNAQDNQSGVLQSLPSVGTKIERNLGKKCDSFIREVKELALQYDFTVKWKNSIVTYYNKGFE